MKTKRWIAGWFAIVAVALGVIGRFVYRIDPYFHYHKPDTRHYYYSLDNQRSQNDGICKYFDYDALITGTSMTENFKTTELDERFGVNAIKVSYSGGSYAEMNKNLINALRHNPELKMIVRGMDTGFFFNAPDLMRFDLGTYPTYLYDDNPLNDVQYLFNKDVIFNRAYAMAKANDADDFQPGITSFDTYSRWQNGYTFGINTVAPDGVSYNGAGEPVPISDDEKKVIYENISRNVTSLADEYPDVDFYYFFTPYSILWYKDMAEAGTIYRQIEAERYVIELILAHENIHLFSINGMESIITDINNYKDTEHYAEWVNSYILRCMHDGEHRLTKDNYEAYLEQELDLLANYDYGCLNGQEDYENDSYAAALMNQDIWGVEPVDVIAEYGESAEYSNAGIVSGQYEGGDGIQCTGRLAREAGSETSVADYIQNEGYVGAKISIPSIGKHNYLVFYGKKIADHAQPTVVVLDGDRNKVGEMAANYHDLDNQWHQYIIDLSGVEGDITVYFNGGYTDCTGNPESEYIFSKIILY